MFIVEFTKTYIHTPRRTWLPGDTPTLDGELAKKLVNELKVAKWVGAGCGCPGIDQATIVLHNTLATRGVTQEEYDAENPEEK